MTNADASFKAQRDHALQQAAAAKRRLADSQVHRRELLEALKQSSKTSKSALDMAKRNRLAAERLADALRELLMEMDIPGVEPSEAILAGREALASWRMCPACAERMRRGVYGMEHGCGEEADA